MPVKINGLTFYDTEEMRGAILGKGWKGCLSCNHSGLENWNDDGDDLRPGHSSDPDRCNGDCETCDGLGFVPMPQ